MNKTKILLLPLSAVALLSACAQVPTQPTIAVMPGPNKPFEVFQAEDMQCRGYASQQVGGQTKGEAVNNNTAVGAVAGTALGAAAGAIIGGGKGAAIGAGGGLLVGAAAGNSNGYGEAGGLQRQYNVTYAQCMYSKGNQLPVQQPRYQPNYQPGYYPPPPPRGYY
jgi:outer membrane lipoprotein SlyB